MAKCVSVRASKHKKMKEKRGLLQITGQWPVYTSKDGSAIVTESLYTKLRILCYYLVIDRISDNQKSRSEARGSASGGKVRSEIKETRLPSFCTEHFRKPFADTLTGILSDEPTHAC